MSRSSINEPEINLSIIYAFHNSPDLVDTEQANSNGDTEWIERGSKVEVVMPNGEAHRGIVLSTLPATQEARVRYYDSPCDQWRTNWFTVDDIVLNTSCTRSSL